MPDLDLFIQLEGGKTHTCRVAGDIKVSELLEENFPDKRPPGWIISDQETGRPLNPDQTLIQNGVRNNHHLLVRQQPSPRIPPVRPPTPAPDSRRWILIVVLLLLAGIVAYLIGRS